MLYPILRQIQPATLIKSQYAVTSACHFISCFHLLSGIQFPLNGILFPSCHRQNSYPLKLKLTYLVFFVNSCFRIFTFFPAYSSHYPAYSSNHLFSHPWQEAAQMSLPVLLSVSRIQILIIFYQKKERLVLLSGHLCHSFCLYLSFLFSVFIGCF